MVFVRVVLNVLPEKRLELTQMLLSLMEPIEKETGCLNTDLFCDVRDNNCFNLVEEWEDFKFLNKHIESYRFGVLLGSRSLLSKPLDIVMYTDANSDGMNFANFIRNYPRVNTKETQS